MTSLRAIVTEGFVLLNAIQAEYWSLSPLGLQPPAEDMAADLVARRWGELQEWRRKVEAALPHEWLIRFQHCPELPRRREWAHRDLVSDICSRLHEQLDWLDNVACEPADPGKATNNVKTPENPEPMARLLALYTNSIANEKFIQAAGILDAQMTLQEKLVALDREIKIPAYASSRALAAALNVTHQAIQATQWWESQRKGRQEEQVENRRERLSERGRGYERGE